MQMEHDFKQARQMVPEIVSLCLFSCTWLPRFSHGKNFANGEQAKKYRKQNEGVKALIQALFQATFVRHQPSFFVSPTLSRYSLFSVSSLFFEFRFWVFGYLLLRVPSVFSTLMGCIRLASFMPFLLSYILAFMLACLCFVVSFLLARLHPCFHVRWCSCSCLIACVLALFIPFLLVCLLALVLAFLLASLSGLV